MSGEAISGIDHLLIVVRDLDSAAATYRRLSFTLSPRAVTSSHICNANHTIMLERDYFELLAVRRRRRPSAGAVRWGTEGPALRRRHRAAAAGAAWREAGFAAATFRVRAGESRRWIRMEARFEVVTLPDGRCRRCRSSPVPS
jgi:hypothetical protein